MGKRRFGVPTGVGDWVLGVSVAALMVGTGWSEESSGTGLDLLGYALLALGGLALVARRRAPVVVLAVTALCAFGYRAAGFDVLAVAYLVAVYGAVRAGHRALTLTTSVALLVTLHLTSLAVREGPVGEALVQARGTLEIAWLIAAFAAGEAVRQAECRAEAAERTREETARRRADEERLHIARELHDALTHQISIIKLQADVAVHVTRRRGEEVPEALLAIQEAGREACRELRATLEVLRDDDTTPPRGLDHVPELVERARAVGVDTSLTISGQRQAMPTAVDRTVYRIVQESLTNIARHAAASTASVLIVHRPDSLAIRIDDDGGAVPGTTPVPGMGLLGMHERVTALGGRLRAEPREEGGFTVHAELPVEQTS